MNNDIRKQFGVNKCAILIMKINSNGTILPQDNVIRSVWNNEEYKYLRVLQEDKMMEREMKE